jgi:hypothetical protein
MQNGNEYINKVFETRATIQIRIQAKLVSLFQNAKSKLEMYYINTAMYSPHAVVPSTYTYKITDGDHWKWFCTNVDQSTQGPRSRDTSPERGARNGVSTDGSTTDHASDLKLVQLWGCVIYCHSKVFMVQATRLYSLICNLVDTCGRGDLMIASF